MIKFNSLYEEIDFFSPNPEIRVKVETFADQKVAIVDNFYKYPEKVRELSQQIPATRSPGIIHGLPGSRVEATFHFGHLGYFFDEVINHVFPEDMEGVESDFIKNCVDRASFLVNVQNSNLPPRVPHIDNPSKGRWAAGIYLNTPEECIGGTAFYKYKSKTSVNIYEELTQEDMKKYQYYVQETAGDWEKIYLAEMKYNRMIIYRQSALHTPYIPPNTFTDENPRRIQMFFI